jgi:hypothetical protein
MSRTALYSPIRLLAAVSLLALFSACGSVDPDIQDDVMSADGALKSRLPEIPAALAVPAGNRLAFTLYAEGVQIYDCKAAADGSLSWVFRAPEADLFAHHHQVGTHYAGPTWEAFDGSKVVGARVAGATVDTTAIPWLLLSAASNTGRGLMSDVTFIQRLSTVAGLAPTAGCDASSAGAEARVDYTATYAFYRASCR